MQVHHLNCGSMHPVGAPAVVCHVLLVETNNGLVLIDTGYGLRDIAQPTRLGPTRHYFRPALATDEAAACQIERLGFAREDVRHIVVTHFDVDHIGGISDFPEAHIHTTAAELLGAVRNPSLREKVRFRPAQWAHGPKFVEHTPDGEKWRGFAAAKELTDIAAGIVLVALPGHTRGHACIGVDAGHRWLLHCGDAFYHPGTIDGQTPVPRAVRTLEPILALDRKRVRDNHARLAELYRRGEPDLLMLCSHDASLFAHAKSTA
ncbi:MBL fold metallo-hydrolase [Micromonospora sp. WMMD736]|uniref:MBL fold metallo-hydrolase n=1 Tax=Micromonospora sp. WMMD736 TaxID=3404112 RepID=UPI003B92C5CF